MLIFHHKIKTICVHHLNKFTFVYNVQHKEKNLHRLIVILEIVALQILNGIKLLHN